MYGLVCIFYNARITVHTKMTMTSSLEVTASIGKVVVSAHI